LGELTIWKEELSWGERIPSNYKSYIDMFSNGTVKIDNAIAILDYFEAVL